MLHIHELNKVINDLSSRGEPRLAFQLCEQYVEHFDDGYLYFRYQTLAAEFGDLDKTLALMTAAIDENRWISAWFIERFNTFPQFRGNPRFEKLLDRLRAVEADYHRSQICKPVTQLPGNAQPPYPLLIALHGGGLNPEHSSDCWSAANRLGWLTTHPLAQYAIGYRQHSWDDYDASRATVRAHVDSVLQQYEVDEQRIVFAGFSGGGQVALRMALEGDYDAAGFVIVGAGGHMFNKPDEYWQPLIAQAPEDLRGAMLYSAFDMEMERSGGDVRRLLALFEQHALAVEFIKLDLAGHGFPDNFEELLRPILAQFD